VIGFRGIQRNFHGAAGQDEPPRPGGIVEGDDLARVHGSITEPGPAIEQQADGDHS
jgi:hypothetical protein